MTPPRSRATSAAQRARALTIRATVQPSRKRLREAVRQLLPIAWDARTAGDWPSWREVMRHVRSLRDQLAREGYRMDADERAARLQVLHTSPAQLTRLAEQRVHADDHRIPRSEAQTLEHQRNLQRWRAEAVCQALWAQANNERQWEAIPTRPHTVPVFNSDAQTTATTVTPQRLVVRVPGFTALGIEEHTVRIYRAQYEDLLEQWGYTQLQKVRGLRNRLNLPPGSKPSRAADELERLALDAYVRQPAFALPWADYLASPRMPAIFVYDMQKKAMRLAPRRSGDLRECALALVALVELAGVRLQPVC